MFVRCRANAWGIVGKYLRTIHTVPVLAEDFAFQKNGIEGLYSPVGYKTAWLDYQTYLTRNLSLHTSGTENELRTPFQILLQTAKSTTDQCVFHYASQAHNNHFAMEAITTREKAMRTRPSRYIMERLANLEITDVNALREHILYLADSSFGQGWVFLVELSDKQIHIVRCNNDGTPYYYGKNQSLDLNGGIDESRYEYWQSLKVRAAAKERDWSLPLFAISFWHVSFIHDYGINGKSEYLKRVWDCINWNIVNSRLFQI